jgi:hypothetical protein
MQEPGGGWVNPFGLGGRGPALGGLGAGQESCKIEKPSLCDNIPHVEFNTDPSNCGSCSGTPTPVPDPLSVKTALESELANLQKLIADLDHWYMVGVADELRRYRTRANDIEALLRDGGQFAQQPGGAGDDTYETKWEPRFGESLVPVAGSAFNMQYQLYQNNYGRATLYGALAISDVFLVRSLATAAGKLSVSAFRFLFGTSMEGASHVAFEVGGTVFHGVTDTVVDIGKTTVEVSKHSLADWARRFWVLKLPIFSKELAVAGKGLEATNCATAALSAYARGLTPLAELGRAGMLQYLLTHGSAGVLNWTISLFSR